MSFFTLLSMSALLLYLADGTSKAGQSLNPRDGSSCSKGILTREHGVAKPVLLTQTLCQQEAEAGLLPMPYQWHWTVSSKGQRLAFCLCVLTNEHRAARITTYEQAGASWGHPHLLRRLDYLL